MIGRKAVIGSLPTIYAELDPETAPTGLSVSGSGTILTHSGAAGLGGLTCATTLGQTTGKAYVELTLQKAYSDVSWFIGIGQAPFPETVFGQDAYSCGWLVYNGYYEHNTIGAKIWPSVERGSDPQPWIPENHAAVTVGLAIDFDARKMSVVGADGVHDTSLSPAISGTGPLHVLVSINSVFTGWSTILKLNAGQETFVHPVPAGYAAGISEG